MPKKIKSWEELAEVESQDYKLVIDLEYECGWIKPKVETRENENERIYLSTHTFYGSHYQWATKLLQEHGFDVELVEDK